MINSIGLPNKGLRGYLEHDLPELARLPVPLDHERHGLDGRRARARSSRRSTRATRSPRSSSTSPARTSRPGLDIGADPASWRRCWREVRPRTAKPLIVKLTPNTADVAAVAQAAEAAGADAVSLINTLRAYAPHPRRAGDAVAGRRDRRAARSGGPRGRPRAGRARSPRASRSRSSAWAASRPALHAARHARGGRDARRRRHRELPRSGRGNTDLTRACTICSQRAGTTSADRRRADHRRRRKPLQMRAKTVNQSGSDLDLRSRSRRIRPFRACLRPRAV